MYELHTTDAFVLTSYPHGESSRAYKLFTRAYGVVYAHGQGVRELRNRNRYALRTHALAHVTLVRGREVWRITGARTPGAEADTGSTRHDPSVLAWRRTLSLIGRLLPVEDPSPALFAMVHDARKTFAEAVPDKLRTLEAFTVLRMLNELGYIARPHDSFVEQILAGPVVDVAILHDRHRELVRAVNAALAEVP